MLLVTGRSTNLERSGRLFYCDFCGPNGVHIECEGLDVHKSDFSCLNCKEPMDRLVRQDRVRMPDNTPSSDLQGVEASGQTNCNWKLFQMSSSF